MLIVTFSLCLALLQHPRWELLSPCSGQGMH